MRDSNPRLLRTVQVPVSSRPVISVISYPGDYPQYEASNCKPYFGVIPPYSGATAPEYGGMYERYWKALKYFNISDT